MASVGERGETPGSLYIAVRNVKWCRQCGKRFNGLSKR